MIYRVEKYLDGFSCCFRQWHADHSHCRFLHGYAIAFRLYFKAQTLDKHNWVWDFGWLKNPALLIDGMTAKAWFSHMFDHTVILEKNDPALDQFRALDHQGLLQLRVIDKFSCEGMAELVLNKVGRLIREETDARVCLYRVDAIENNKSQASAEING
ncbi:MAG: 6-pyruvoyl trahydropterin synthase family protein [Francisellaceae bacterium]